MVISQKIGCANVGFPTRFASRDETRKLNSHDADVVAVVVTYHPDAKLQSRLQAIRSQVDGLVVIDNGSRNVNAVHAAATQSNCDVIRNQANMGIAHALNQAAAVAIERGATWLAMFDQDSDIPTGAVATLLATYSRAPDPEAVAIVAMSRRDRGADHDYHLVGDILDQNEDMRSVRTTITSGSMIRLDLFRLFGDFDEKLFIDSVDLDYCLRLRCAGFQIIESLHAVMSHALGNAERKAFLGRDFILTHHGPSRRYYITRNQLEVARRYARRDPRWSARTLKDLLVASLTTLAFEPARAENLGAMLRGLCDFVLRRFGPRP